MSNPSELHWSRRKALKSTLWVLLVGQFMFAVIAIGSGIALDSRSLFSNSDTYDSIADSWYLFLIPLVLSVPYYYQYPKPGS